MVAAQADESPVLIEGSPGTGRGEIARWIHENSPLATRPFRLANLKSPLAGQIVEARGGTLLIPELSEFPLADQQVLLHYLEKKSLPQAGVPMLVHTRIIASTSHNLESRSQGGLFNSALLKRFQEFRIQMPPLSERIEEFEDIVEGLLREICRETKKEHVRKLSTDAWEKLKSYSWPGNLRELRNVLRLAILRVTDDTLRAVDFPNLGDDQFDFRATREQFEKIYLTELLKTYDWKIEETCQGAKMDRETLVFKMKKYGITETAKSLPQG